MLNDLPRRIEREFEIESGHNEFEGFQTHRIFNLQVGHDSPGQRPSTLPSPVQRAGFATHDLIARAKGPAICDASNRHVKSRSQMIGPLALPCLIWFVTQPVGLG